MKHLDYSPEHIQMLVFDKIVEGHQTYDWFVSLAIISSWVTIRTYKHPIFEIARPKIVTEDSLSTEKLVVWNLLVKDSKKHLFAIQLEVDSTERYVISFREPKKSLIIGKYNISEKDFILGRLQNRLNSFHHQYHNGTHRAF